MKNLPAIKDYLLELAFLALLIRVVAIGCGLGEALALVSVVVSMAYNKWLVKNKIEDRAELEARLDAALKDVNEKFDSMSNKVNSLSMNQSMKRTEPNEQKTPISGLGTAKRYF